MPPTFHIAHEPLYLRNFKGTPKVELLSIFWRPAPFKVRTSQKFPTFWVIIKLFFTKFYFLAKRSTFAYSMSYIFRNLICFSGQFDDYEIWSYGKYIWHILIGRLVYYVLLMVFALMINKSAETIWIANVVVREPKKHNLSLQTKAIPFVLKIKTTNTTQYNIWLSQARMLCFFCIHKELD